MDTLRRWQMHMGGEVCFSSCGVDVLFAKQLLTNMLLKIKFIQLKIRTN
jgi:hypothetical protein